MNIIQYTKNLFKPRVDPLRASYCNDNHVPKGEIGIKWEIDPELFPFVRVVIVRSHFRSKRPRIITGGLVIGHSVIGKDAPKIDDRFLMRVFYLQEMDLKPGCLYRKCFHRLPFEGVRTGTIRPGVWGSLQ